MRDLGAHISLSSAFRGGTLTARMRQVRPVLSHLQKIPTSQSLCERVVRMKILPAALYGCQVAPVATGALKALRSGVADTVLRGGAANRSCDL
eukprot:11787873-Alexandrium_andersonii.AAC.1